MEEPALFDTGVFFGESHTDSVCGAVGVRGWRRHRAFKLAHIEYPLSEEVFSNPSFIKALEVPGGGRCLYVSMLGGNAHNILGLVAHRKPFDFTLPEEPHLANESGSEPQTYAFVEHALKSLMSYNLCFLRCARNAVDGPMLHLQSPPPIEDETLIQADLAPRLATSLNPVGIAPPLLRYKLWRLHSKIVASTCAMLGIEYVPVPPKVLVDGRFLQPIFFQDATHANGAYGEVILDQLSGRFTS